MNQLKKYVHFYTQSLLQGQGKLYMIETPNRI